MCAPALGMERTVSTSAPHSPIDAHNGISSPNLENIIGKLPIYQTPDNKTWLDLETLSPKLLQELNRQYLLTTEESKSGFAARGAAAKFKGWVRRSMLGVDVRLRRKISAKRDQVIDIRIVPDTVGAQSKPLDANGNEILELDGEAVAELESAIPELYDIPRQSGPLAVMSLDNQPDLGQEEPPPLYRPREANAVSAQSSGAAVETGSSPELSNDSHVGDSPTPGMPAPLQRADNSLATREVSDGPHAFVSDLQSGLHSNEAPTASKSSVDAGKKEEELPSDDNLSQSLQQIPLAIQQNSTDNRTEDMIAVLQPANAISNVPRGHLQIKATKFYDVETDVEPASPNESTHDDVTTTKRSTAYMKLKKGSLKSRPPVGTKRKIAPNNFLRSSETLYRRQTLPKRPLASAGIEGLWTSLLRMQMKIFGPDHPLVLEAKAERERFSNEHRKVVGADLSSLRQSSSVAANNFSPDHPWASAFAQDLDILENLLQAQLDDRLNDGTQEINEKVPSHEATTLKTLPKLETSHIENTPTLAGKQSQAFNLDDMWNAVQPPHQPQSNCLRLPGLVFEGTINLAMKSLLWLQRNCGPEQPVEPGKVRVRWTCTCGKELYDDFVELRPGASRALEAYLNRPRVVVTAGNTPTSPSSSHDSYNFSGSSIGGGGSTHTSWSSYSSQGMAQSMRGDGNSKAPQTTAGSYLFPGYHPTPEPPWLLTCANEDRYTPKLAHLDMGHHRIRSDKDLALSLRDHYFQVNKKWWRSLRIRGLTTIEFVQFEVHQNRFADIRKCPDVPPISTPEYVFEPGDLLPPVGSQYLIHLFRHPEDYEGEIITYSRAPKRNGRLQIGKGWGINLVEGFLAHRVWMAVSGLFALGSLAFLIAWAVKKVDVQGASGVAAWLVALGVLAVGWLQAYLG